MMRDFGYTESRHRVLRSIAESAYIRRAARPGLAAKFNRRQLKGRFTPFSGAEGRTLNLYWDAEFITVDWNQEIPPDSHLVVLTETGQNLLNEWNGRKPDVH